MTSIHSAKKSLFRYLFEIVFAIIVALIIATIVRQMWFELYEIPTGSMRPSFREQDRLTVTKTTFGLNIPLETEHFYFDPNLVERAKIFIFSGTNIPSLDENTAYFGIIPYTKRYIKRMIGKPGDSLYFYGGKIYGIDKEGNSLNVLQDDPWMKQIEHIPFINFEGNVSMQGNQTILFEHMGKAIGKLSYTRTGTFQGEINVNGAWKKERPFEKNQTDEISSMGQFWGINNFAMARLLSPGELKEWTTFHLEDLEEAELYLQLRHSPNLVYPPPRIYKDGQHMGIQLSTFESVIPLKKEHIQAIRDHMYTSRFVIKSGRTKRYSAETDNFLAGNPHFSDVPDGTYEIYNGKAEQVGFYGWTSELGSTHPLNSTSTTRIKELFNMGIEMLTSYEPSAYFQIYYPHRYAYFRDGDLYLLGAPIFNKKDPILQKYIASEKAREAKATTELPYKPFLDRGPPLKNGVIDKEYIKTFGVKIPEKNYLALGDNHAMSMDSRLFGFVPENNIQGAPAFVLWPPGNRWGTPPQTPYPFLSIPRVIVWSIAGTILLIWYFIRRRRLASTLPDKN